MTNGPAQKLALDPHLDAWERQPKESLKRYAHFCQYRDQGRTRTLQKTAEALAMNARHVRQTASDFRWVERVDAYDRYLDRLHEQTWLEERRRAAEADARVLSALMGKVVERLPTLKGADLSVTELTRLLDVLLKQRRLLFGDPTETVAVTGPGGDPLTVHLEEFEKMPAEQRQAEIQRMLAAVARRSQAAAGVRDDDD